MFSGIVEEAGRIHTIRRSGEGIRMVVEARLVGRGVRTGDSIAVNGCCLTLVRVEAVRAGRNSGKGRAGKGAGAGAGAGLRRLHFDLLEETWRKTGFEALTEGSLVNLERSLRVDDRIGGHFVTGHVDGTGEITRWERSGADWVLEVRPPAGMMRYFLYKGSVAIDGISLTVAEVLGDRIRSWIIPHTWEVTNLQERKVGDPVNLEADLLGKYVERLIEARESAGGSRRPPSSKVR